MEFDIEDAQVLEDIMKLSTQTQPIQKKDFWQLVHNSNNNTAIDIIHNQSSALLS